MNLRFKNEYSACYLSTHFGEDRTKSILFASKQRSKNVRQLNIRCNHINIKQHSQVTYLACVLEETMSVNQWQ